MDIEVDKLSSYVNRMERTTNPSCHTRYSNFYRGPRDKFVRIFVRKDDSALVKPSSDHIQTFSDQIAIPWREKIIRASVALMKEFKGNFDDLLNSLGGDTPKEFEKRFTKVKIPWNGKIIWATPFQILRSEGDIDRLRSFLSTHSHLSDKTLQNIKRGQNSGSPF